jgi:hypothetical protein
MTYISDRLQHVDNGGAWYCGGAGLGIPGGEIPGFNHHHQRRVSRSIIWGEGGGPTLSPVVSAAHLSDLSYFKVF